MGIKNVARRIGDKAGNKVARLAALSSEQIEEVQSHRGEYLLEMPDPSDEMAVSTTWKMMAASSIEIFNSYLPQIKELYLPIDRRVEYDGEFSPEHNIRYINITKWVTDKKENSLEKLVNVYAVLSNEDCNIALVFHRKQKGTETYLAVVNTDNADNNVATNSYMNRLLAAIKGNFPGAEYTAVNTEYGEGTIPCMDNDRPYSVAMASNIPTEKSEKFISQTIEKLLDGIVPDSKKKEYIIVLLATPIMDIEDRKQKLSEFYSGFRPYAEWETNYTYTENNSVGSSATVGVNVGASAGIQNGNNYSVTEGNSETDNESMTRSKNQSESNSYSSTNSTSKNISDTTSRSESNAVTKGTSDSLGVNASVTSGVSTGTSANVGGGLLPASVTGEVETSLSGTLGTNIGHGVNESTAKTLGESVAKAISKGVTQTLGTTLSETTGTAVANTLGKALTKSMSVASGVSKATNLGANLGANFARSSTVTAMIGKNEGITQHFMNHGVKHALELLENQMKRYEQSTALGMWDFAAYVLSEDSDVAGNVAHSYLALTLGEESYMSKSAINVWKGNVDEEKSITKEIAAYIRELRHPLFGLNEGYINEDRAYSIYPAIVTGTTSLSGKELAYSLNFPRKSIAGLPVLECAEFGRNVVAYDAAQNNTDKIALGNIFHMNHLENNRVELTKQSLASHTFITGSTGSGKSNTVYQLVMRARKSGVKFLVVEPAKGEYKNIFGGDKDVSVYGTNPTLSPLLRINPFSFPPGIHILEHLDRLVEIFNVCWPMYAAMPAVLKKAIEKSYTDCGWDLISSKNIYDSGLYPAFSDVAQNIREIINESEYDDENKGAYKGSLLTRLESLTNGINGMIFVSDEIPAERLFNENVIADLSRVGSTETKSLIMGMLVLKLQEYRMTNANGMNEELKHVTVLEEAHNILRRTSTEQSSDSANLMGKSVEMLANAIAEMRTYGEGFIIADQAPGLMDMSVIRNTNTKIIMRLPDQSDRELVGRAASLNEDQITELAKLPCGVAAVYQNEWVQPVLCKVDRFEKLQKPYFYLHNPLDASSEKAGIESSILDCIMNKEIFKKGNKLELHRIKKMAIQSKMGTRVKVDLIKYLDSDDEKDFETLRILVYDFLEADKAIKLSQQCGDLNEWLQEVVSKFSPSIQDYTNEQIDLVIALVLYEQAKRRPEYGDLFCKFTEIYQAEGKVY